MAGSADIYTAARVLGDKLLSIPPDARHVFLALPALSVNFPTLHVRVAFESLSLMSEPLIVIDRLAKSFGGQVAVQGLSMSIPRGEVFGFLGANGAGKTTTIRMLCGL